MNANNHASHHRMMIRDFRRRFFVSLGLTVPILVLSPTVQGILNYSLSFPFSRYVLFALASAIFLYGGWPFLKGLADELKSKQPGMMTLIAVAITTAYGYSSVVVFGLPGNPSSSMVTFEQLVRPALLKMMAYPSLERLTVEATAAERFAATDGKTHFKSARLTRDGEGYAVRLAGGQGSHMLTSMARANAFVVLTPERQQVEVGERIRVQLIDPPERIS